MTFFDFAVNTIDYNTKKY